MTSDLYRDNHHLYVNVGCGRTPTAGWVNVDNSWFVRLARHRIVLTCLKWIGIASIENLETAARARRYHIVWADAAHRLPFRDCSVCVLYSSHMLEHLDRDEVLRFLKECRRVMRSSGILRIVCPDLRCRVEQYLSDCDADEFMRSLNLESRSFHTIRAKLKMLIAGNREHQWMYDGHSLSALLATAGFVDVKEIQPGETGIGNPGMLELRERESESIYIEACQP